MTAQSDFLAVSVTRRRNNSFDHNAPGAAFSLASGNLPTVKELQTYDVLHGSRWLIDRQRLNRVAIVILLYTRIRQAELARGSRMEPTSRNRFPRSRNNERS